MIYKTKCPFCHTAIELKAAIICPICKKSVPVKFNKYNELFLDQKQIQQIKYDHADLHKQALLMEHKQLIMLELKDDRVDSLTHKVYCEMHRLIESEDGQNPEFKEYHPQARLTDKNWLLLIDNIITLVNELKNDDEPFSVKQASEREFKSMYQMFKQDNEQSLRDLQ